MEASSSPWLSMRTDTVFATASKLPKKTSMVSRLMKTEPTPINAPVEL